MELSELETSWSGRIKSAARDAIHTYKPGDWDTGYDGRHDHVTETVERMLFDADDWEGVPATAISDVAYEAATKALDAQREAAWAADRQMVADMERDGLL